MSEIRILNLCHKKSILVDIYRQLLLSILALLSIEKLTHWAACRVDSINFLKVQFHATHNLDI